MRVLGVPVRIDGSWVLIAAVVGWIYLDLLWLGQGGPLPAAAYAGAPLAVAGFLVSLLAHELGHALASRAYGQRVLGISLYLMGGVTESVGETRRARDEFVIVGMGPLLSGAVGAGLLGIARLGPPEPLWSVALFLGWGNVLLALFNVVPGYPLDGGRLLRALLWGATGRRHAATRWAARLGQGFAVALGGYGLWRLSADGGLGGVWELVLAFFLWRGAADAHTQAARMEGLADRVVREVMGQAPPALDPVLTVAEAIERIQERPSLVWPVGAPARGALTLARVDEVPDHRWMSARVGDVALPLDGRTVPAETSLEAALPALVAAPEHMLLVVEQGVVVGLLTPSLLGPEVLGDPAA